MAPSAVGAAGPGRSAFKALEITPSPRSLSKTPMVSILCCGLAAPGTLVPVPCHRSSSCPAAAQGDAGHIRTVCLARPPIGQQSPRPVLYVHTVPVQECPHRLWTSVTFGRMQHMPKATAAAVVAPATSFLCGYGREHDKRSWPNAAAVTRGRCAQAVGSLPQRSRRGAFASGDSGRAYLMRPLNGRLLEAGRIKLVLSASCDTRSARKGKARLKAF